MKMKSFKYNNRQGYTLEWHEPNTLVLEPIETMALICYIASNPNLEDFSLSEQVTIHAYLSKQWSLFYDNIQELETSNGFGTSRQQFKQWLYVLTHSAMTTGESTYEKLKKHLPRLSPRDVAL